MFIQERRVLAARRRLEDIAEISPYDGGRWRVHIEIDFSPRHDDQGANVIDPMNMISMRVGQQNSVEMCDPESKQLFAKIRRHIQKNLRFGPAFPRALDEQ